MKSVEIEPIRMPVLFVGHGSPMNAIEQNDFSNAWKDIGDALPKPVSILCISAHWETWGTLVTAMPEPRTIHDFGGFPHALYEAQYPAPGSPELAQTCADLLKPVEIRLDFDWGLDHGCWSILNQMYPKADIPVVQLSLDHTKSPLQHYQLAISLKPLRKLGVLILGSGNLVHNLRRMVLPGNDFRNINKPYGFDWAVEANATLKSLIMDNQIEALSNYADLGDAVKLAIPTPEHYLPMLYALALREDDDELRFFNDQPIAGSLTMTSFILDKPG